VMNVHDMTWVNMLLGGVERVHDVREMGLQREQAAGAGKQVNMTIWRARTSWELTETLWSIAERCCQTDELGEQFCGVEDTYRRAATTAIRQELS